MLFLCFYCQTTGSHWLHHRTQSFRLPVPPAAVWQIWWSKLDLNFLWSLYHTGLLSGVDIKVMFYMYWGNATWFSSKYLNCFKFRVLALSCVLQNLLNSRLFPGFKKWSVFHLRTRTLPCHPQSWGTCFVFALTCHGVQRSTQLSQSRMRATSLIVATFVSGRKSTQSVVCLVVSVHFQTLSCTY